MNLRKKRNSLLVLMTAAGLVLGGGALTAIAASPAPAVSSPTTEAVVPAAVPAADADGWFTSWTQSQQRAGKVFTNQSVRVITHLSQGGDGARIRVQNQFAPGAITITQTSLALSAGGAAIDAASNRVLTFGGNESVTIPKGGEVWSDPTSIVTTPQQDVAVTFFLAQATTSSLHERSGHFNYGTVAGTGNLNAQANGASFTDQLTWTYFVTAVDVYNTSLVGTIVAYGSSIVDGTGSDYCGSAGACYGQHKRWTDNLARRVVAELPANQQFAVVNEGIGGTVSSPTCQGGGNDGVSRLDRDVLALHGVTGVIFYYGTNDLQNGCDEASTTASYHTIFARLRAAGVKVFVTPITPRSSYDTGMNLQRTHVNAFVRQGGNCSGECDGVIDFDEVLRDPANPNLIRAEFGIPGDTAHVNVAAQLAEANAVPLQMLATAGVPSITSVALSPAKAGSSYSFTVPASGFPAPAFTVSAGALPAGLSLDPATGKISGTPTVGGVATFTIMVSNTTGSSEKELTMIVRAAPAITSGVPLRATIGEQYSFTVAATGYPAATFAVSSGVLPAGLSLNPTTGEISGTPTTLGATMFAITASNGVNPEDTAAYAFSVREAPVIPALATSTTTVSVAGARVSYGKKASVTVTVRSAGVTPTGTVRLTSGSTTLATGTLTASAGPAGVATLKIKIKVKRRALAPGKHTLTATYAGDSKVSGSSVTSSMRVTKAKASVKVKTAKKVTTHKRAKVTVTVKAAGVPRVTGKVVVYDGKHKVGTAKLRKSGKVVVQLPRLKAGKHKINVTYRGSSLVAKATSKKVTVTAKR